MLAAAVNTPFSKPASVRALQGMLLIHPLSRVLTFSDGQASPLLCKASLPSW